MPDHVLFPPDLPLSCFLFEDIQALSFLHMFPCQVCEQGAAALRPFGVHSAGAMAGESMDKSYKLRFRHLSGDVGPLTFQENSTVLAMKSQIWEEWPTEEPLSSQVSFARLLCAMGQFRHRSALCIMISDASISIPVLYSRRRVIVREVSCRSLRVFSTYASCTKERFSKIFKLYLI